MRVGLLLVAFLASCLSGKPRAQHHSHMPDSIGQFPPGISQQTFIARIDAKIGKFNTQLSRQTEKYLQRLQKKERKLQKKLQRTDSAAASQLGDIEMQYARMKNGLQDATAGSLKGEYFPYLDTLKTSLSFLQHNNSLASPPSEIQGKIQSSLQKVTRLQSGLRQSEQIKSFIRQRQELMKQALSRYTKLPKGISKMSHSYSKQFYYYSQQVREYKELLNDPDKLTRKALDLLSRSGPFKQFMREHSELSALFGVPGNYGTPQALTGLQTRVQVQQLIQTQVAAGGPDARQAIRQNIQDAQSRINQLKDKINKLGGGNSDMDIPDFKPNSQKTKSFWKRLELGTNLQSTKSNNFFPVTTDIGLSVGYKLNDKSIIGIGASYKVGWGRDIRHVSITSEGMGLRSFADMKLKGSFYASGGFEYNYQPVLKELSGTSPSGGGREGATTWQQSGLIGLSKIVSQRSKLFKKARLQLLWDFLSYQQIPRTQAVKFRIGYNF
jgi:hypothetical protein